MSPRYRLPSLSALRAFEAAARLGSFTAAAVDLHITQGAVSRQVNVLEGQLGVKLFQRHARGLILTAAGTSFLPAVQEGFETIGRAASRLRAREPGLTLKVPPTFGVRWLIPRLARFQREHPEVPVSVTTVWRLEMDFTREDYDAGIDFGRGRWTGLSSDRLLVEHMVPVCSPALLSEGPPLKEPADLRRHVLLHPTLDHIDWRTWLERFEVQGVNPDRGEDFDTMETAMAAAAVGHGVTVGAFEFIQDDLTAGRLVMPFGPRLASAGAYYLVYPADRLAREDFCLFRQWLLTEVVGGHRRV